MSLETTSGPEISSPRAPHTRISLEERWPFEIATFISLVNSHAPGTTKEKETHLPTKCKQWEDEVAKLITGLIKLPSQRLKD